MSEFREIGVLLELKDGEPINEIEQAIHRGFMMGYKVAQGRFQRVDSGLSQSIVGHCQPQSTWVPLTEEQKAFAEHQQDLAEAAAFHLGALPR